MLIKAFASDFVFSTIKYFLILHKVWSLYDALLQSSLMCFLKVRFLSNFIPRNVTSFEFLIWTLLIWILKDLSFLLPRTINRNLPGLIFNELILNYSITTTRSVFRFKITFSMFFPTLYSVLSSAKLQTPDFLLNKTNHL